MHYVLIAMVLAVYVAAFVLAADGRFGLALALSVFASGTYWVSRQRFGIPDEGPLGEALTDDYPNAAEHRRLSARR
jgi:hypothetical protein